MRALVLSVVLCLITGVALAAPLAPTNDADHRYGWQDRAYFGTYSTFQGNGDGGAAAAAADAAAAAASAASDSK
jgi:hypothetical protein